MSFCCRRAIPNNVVNARIISTELDKKCKQDSSVVSEWVKDLTQDKDNPGPDPAEKDSSVNRSGESESKVPGESENNFEECFSQENLSHSVEETRTRESILEELSANVEECSRPNVREAFSKLPHAWKQDKCVALKAIDLDPTGRVLRALPESLREDREVVLKAVGKIGTSLAYVQSDLLKNDREVALAAVTQTTRAFKHVGKELKRNREFIIEMLEGLVSCRSGNTCSQKVLDVREEPKRVKVNKYHYAMPKAWPGNLTGGFDDPDFGDGNFELPFGTDVGEETEERKVEIITLDTYAGQSEIVKGIDETIIHDAKVLELLFEADCVAVLFNDITRREMLSDTSSVAPSSRPMRASWKRIVEEWHSNHEKKRGELQRLMCWPTRFWQPRDLKEPVAIADNIHFWIECVQRTSNPSLLAEAPKHILADEDKMLEAVKIDIELFRITPWRLRVSETFKSKVQDAFPTSFLWITLEDSRAEIPSKARDSEMGEMIAAFGAVQKATGKQQHQVPFLQLSPVPAAPALARTRTAGF